MAYTAPVIIFLYYQCFIAGEWRLPGRGLRLTLPYAVVGFMSFYLGVAQDPPKMEGTAWPMWEYLITQSNALIEYVRILLLPLPGRLNLDYDFPLAETLWELPTLVSAVSIVSILAMAVLYLGRARLLAFWVLWFFIILAPTSSIVSLRDVIAIRRLYLPGLGFYLLLVVGIHWLFRHLGTRKWYAANWLWRAELAALIGIVVFYGACAYERNKVFRTEITLWEDTVKKSPSKFRPHYNLGYNYKKEGRVMDAWKQYMLCIGIHQRSPDIKDFLERKCCSAAYNNLGMIYSGAALYNVAVRMFEEAIKVYPKSLKAHRNLGNAYFYSGRIEEAEAEYKVDIQLNRENSQAYAGLGLVYESKGMRDEAVDAYTRALKQDPSNADVWIKLGLLWLNHKNNPAKALQHLLQAQRVCTSDKTLVRIKEIVGTINNQGLSGSSPETEKEPD
ncbi:MAG: tetratricopeptide repeat protein [Planctomycetes bacterium]|nr:tetratricopeptide repeat protein [Planctomycetota bacterium]